MSNIAPAVNTTSEIIGIILLFIPYFIILLPFLQEHVVSSLQKLYIHHTPRNDWNNAVDQQPPRRLIGYLLAMLFIFTSIWLLLIKNHVNNYWVDFFQYFIYISIPLILSIIRPPSTHPCDLVDILIILFVIIPIEISQKYDKFLPDISFKIYDSWDNSPNISILRFTGFNLFLFIFFIFRPLQNIGLSWNLFSVEYQNKLYALIRFIIIMLLFLIFAISFCVIPGIKYLHEPDKQQNVWIDGISRYFCLFFFNILLYEFVYRGVIQNLLHSAFDFRHEARSYLRGNKKLESLTDILNHYDNSVRLDSNDEPEDPSDILWNEVKAGGVKNGRMHKNINVKITVNNNVSPKALPYYEDDDDYDVEMYSSFKDRENKMVVQESNNGLLKFDVARDWLILILSSIIYAATIMDYKHYESSKDLIYGGILMFWLGFCCGWLFRLTRSCFVSAIFNSLIIFNFKYVFNDPGDFCNGAC